MKAITESFMGSLSVVDEDNTEADVVGASVGVATVAIGAAAAGGFAVPGPSSDDTAIA